MNSSSLATCIKLIHYILITYIIVTPFTNSEWLLTLHAIMMPGLMVHWITNNNMCSLTLLESQLTGQNMDNTFIGKIANPFFEVNDNLIYCAVFGLWLLSLYKLQKTNFRMLRLTFYKLYEIVCYIAKRIKNIIA